MNTKKIILLTAGLTLGFIQAAGQNYESYINLNGPKIINVSKKLPADLLSTKTVVIIREKSANGMPERGNWKKTGVKAHKGFNRAGVDAVAYYYFRDLFAGPDVTTAIVSNWVNREIENLAVLTSTKKISGDSLVDHYELLILSFNKKNSFIDHGEQAWKFSNPSLDKVMLELFRDAARISKRENLLIAETPEFYQDTYMIKGDRFEKFPVDLKVLKMGIPEFETYEVPVNSIERLNEEVDSLNRIIAQKNETLKSVMEEYYPLEYGFYDQSIPEQDLRYKEGYHFLLLYVHTSGRVIKKMLNYDLSETETTFISVENIKGRESLETIPASEPVYKFYFRHILTGKIYLGSEWDADETLEGALGNFLGNLRRDLNLSQ